MNYLLGPLKLRYAMLCLVICVSVGLVAYLVGDHLTPTYQASGIIRVALPSENGTSDPDVTAANDLASQYAQLVNSKAVDALAAARLGVPAGHLNGVLSGSTVAAQNLLQVTATGPTPTQAETRAAAGTSAVVEHLTSISEQESQHYLTSVRSSLDDLAAKKGGPRGTTAAIISAKAQAIADAARDAAGNDPSFQIVDQVASASEASPKPKLYALIAFIVALIVVGRVSYVLASSAANTTGSSDADVDASPGNKAPSGNKPPSSETAASGDKAPSSASWPFIRSGDKAPSGNKAPSSETAASGEPDPD